MRSAVQFLDLDLDLNELGGDISWSGPASHTLLQDPKRVDGREVVGLVDLGVE